MIKAGLRSNLGQQKPLIQRRQFVIATVLTLGGFLFGRNARLADAMDRGELHNKNEDYKQKRKELEEQRIRSIAKSRPMKPRYEGHIPLYAHERALLFITSGLKSYFHPEDGENIVQLGEASAFTFFLENLKETMLSDKTGRRILKDRPDITSESLNMERLKQMPSNTLGHCYYKWLLKEGVSPDTRAPVKYIDDPTPVSYTHLDVYKRQVLISHI